MANSLLSAENTVRRYGQMRTQIMLIDVTIQLLVILSIEVLYAFPFNVTSLSKCTSSFLFLVATASNFRKVQQTGNEEFLSKNGLISNNPLSLDGTEDRSII